MLNDLVNHLTNSGFNPQIHPPSNLIPFPQIWMNLGSHILQIREHLQKVPSRDSPSTGEAILFLEFFLAFPYQIEATLFSDGARLASLINKTSPISGFYLSEADGAIVFQYTYPSLKFSEIEFDSIIHLILYAAESYAPYIKEFSEKKTF